MYILPFSGPKTFLVSFELYDFTTPTIGRK